jgi:Protein of unknown function (DUF3306)
MSRPEDETPVDGGFLGRWARRKQEVQRQDAAPQPAPEGAPDTVPDGAAEELPLPSLDSIVSGSEVTAFFQKHVPEALRTAALRKLWVTDPEIKNFIEMADYQWDFNNPDSIPGWSSSIEGVDVNGMLEKVMGIEKPAPDVSPQPPPAMAPESPQKSSPEPEAEEQPASLEAAKGIRENTESAIKTGTLAEEAMPSDHSLIQNGAVQNSAKESIVYDIVRKRRGGALPT